MTASEFLAWAIAQPRGRYELVQGEVVAMPPERVGHNLLKGEVLLALDRAVKHADLPYYAFVDGAAVVIDEEHVREPDAAVQSKAATNLDAITLEAPLIVVEITSPSPERDDTGEKLVEYFSVPSIQHYLIINPVKKVVIHHARGQGGDIVTRIANSGEIDLTPPGMTVPVAELLPEIS